MPVLRSFEWSPDTRGVPPCADCRHNEVPCHRTALHRRPAQRVDDDDLKQVDGSSALAGGSHDHVSSSAGTGVAKAVHALAAQEEEQARAAEKAEQRRRQRLERQGHGKQHHRRSEAAEAAAQATTKRQPPAAADIDAMFLGHNQVPHQTWSYTVADQPDQPLRGGGGGGLHQSSLQSSGVDPSPTKRTTTDTARSPLTGTSSPPGLCDHPRRTAPALMMTILCRATRSQPDRLPAVHQAPPGHP
eukprot:SAG25_NODE_54_length_18691_cov_566.202076_2_plen_245_part_00